MSSYVGRKANPATAAHNRAHRSFTAIRGGFLHRVCAVFFSRRRRNLYRCTGGQASGVGVKNTAARSRVGGQQFALAIRAWAIRAWQFAWPFAWLFAWRFAPGHSCGRSRPARRFGPFPPKFRCVGGKTNATDWRSIRSVYSAIRVAIRAWQFAWPFAWRFVRGDSHMAIRVPWPFRPARCVGPCPPKF